MKEITSLLFAYFSQIFIAVDQLVNALIPPLTGSISWADETLSARSYRTYRDKKFLGWMMHPINVLFYWQKWDMNHCQRAYENEKNRIGLPPEYRYEGKDEKNS